MRESQLIAGDRLTSTNQTFNVLSINRSNPNI